MEKRIAINACGLHVGGGVQVATSFIHELAFLNTKDLDLHVFVSTEVDGNLARISSPARNSPNYQVKNTYGISSLISDLNFRLANFSLVFTVFGPNYLFLQSGIQLVGFAQAWIIDKSAYRTLKTLDSIKVRAKFFLQKLFFKRADRLVVELEHVREGLVREGIARSKAIDVVHNCISSLYFDPSIWENLDSPITREKFSLGFLGRDYPHKNTALLPDVRRLLAEKHNLDVDFFVTLNAAEWAAKPDTFKAEIINVGSLSVAQCPSFYKVIDAVIFPSLLECFSATPLEAMAMQKPIFASDRGFVRDVCGDFAWYFDPLNPESAADVIAKYIAQNHGKDQDRLAAAREHVVNFSNARQRAESYLNIIRKALTKEF